GHDGADPPPPPERGDTQESPDVQEKEGRGDDDPDAAASEPETPAPEAAAQEGTGEGGGPSQAGNAGEPGAAGTGHVYLVQPGDTLWHVAAGALGESATDAEIAAAWPQWYQANIDIIGPDPDLIHPGQELAAPGGPVS